MTPPEIIRAALAHVVATEINDLATRGAKPGEIIATFTREGGEIFAEREDDMVAVHLHDITELHTSTPHLAIYLWAERAIDAARDMEIRDPLKLFLTLNNDKMLTDLAVTISGLCGAGIGTWTTPIDDKNSTGTHLVEIDFLGIHATGADTIEATRNWRKAAIDVALTKKEAA